MRSKCTAPNCEKPVHGHQLCSSHEYRLLRYNNINEPVHPGGKRIHPIEAQCSFEECNRKIKGRGLCNGHLKQDQAGKKLIPLKKRRIKPAELEGARYIDSKGYVVIYDKDSKCPTHISNKNWALEHRKVMSEYLERSLLPSEQVHHKNSIRTDNRIENLELWIISQPSGGRVIDMLDWAYYIIDLYGKDFS